jgi:pteridine reductase
MKKLSTARKTALVTGGGKRIGQAICLTLSAFGYQIALHYHHSKLEAQKTAQQIKKTGGVCELFKCDLSIEAQTTALIPKVLKRFSTINVLINNASIFKKSNLKKGSLKLFNEHFAVNCKAPYILTAAYAQRCQKGHIINIVDANVAKNKTAYCAYLLSKRGLCDLTKLAAVELAPAIRVNAVAPGLILPPAGGKSGYLEHLARHIPMRRQGVAKHITHAICFLLENDYVTGQIIFEDGGEHLI